MHLLWLGLLLGWGAAIPVGPVNLEITRRHLNHGMSCGMVTGFGACSADLTYLFLLSIGLLSLLNHPHILQVIGLAGAAVLIWFAVQAFKNDGSNSVHYQTSKSLWRNFIEGYAMTLLNPYTIIFWASVSSQISLIAHGENQDVLLTGVGVLAGTISWVLLLNLLLKRTRHKVSHRVMIWLNRLGGVILITFATLGIINAFSF